MVAPIPDDLQNAGSGVFAIEWQQGLERLTVFGKLFAPAHSLWFGDREGYTFDPAGRPLALFRDERRIRRALDGRMIETGWVTGPHAIRVRRVRLLAESERAHLLETMRTRLQALRHALVKGRVRQVSLNHPRSLVLDPQRFLAFLDLLLAWDEGALKEDVRRYQRVYHPVSILPPDQYRALYLQLTIGCYYNRCAFCGFYRDRPYHERDETEFLQHLDAVEAYFGEALRMRDRLFLGDANALHLPADRLLRSFALLNRRYAIGPQQNDSRPSFRGIYSFIDAFTGTHLPQDVLHELAHYRLHRVYLGFESGHDPLRRLLQKPGSAAQAVEAVQRLKRAGIAVGVILLIGIGGQTYREAHRRDSIGALFNMPLDRHDIIYLSPLVTTPGSDYVRLAQEQGWDLPDEMALQLESHEWERLLRSHPRLRGVRIANYDIREFVY